MVISSTRPHLHPDDTLRTICDELREFLAVLGESADGLARVEFEDAAALLGEIIGTAIEAERAAAALELAIEGHEVQGAGEATSDDRRNSP